MRWWRVDQLFFFLILSLMMRFSKSSMIQLISPLYDATFMTFPPSTTATIPLQYIALLPESELLSHNDILVCLSLSSANNVIFENQCMPTTNNNLNLNFVPIGVGSLDIYLVKGGKMIPDSKLSSIFRVVTMESSLPLLRGPPGLHYLANSLTDASDASIEFFLSDLTLSSYLHISPTSSSSSTSSSTSTSKFNFKRTCVPTAQNHLSLHNIPAGSYQLSLEFQQAAPPYTPFPSSRQVSSIIVSRLEDLLPSLFLEHSIVEQGILVEAQDIPEISLSVAARAHPSFPNPDLLSQTDTCITLTPAINSTLQKLHTCIQTSPFIQFTFRQVPRGTHEFSIALRSHHNHEVSFPQSTVKGQIVVEDMREFIPSYDWTELKSWHTIPSGLETRLPIGSGKRKEARIPQPWRLQTSMPSPCKYFLRMDISRTTKMSDIRAAAATKCRMPVHCFGILVEGALVEDYEITSEKLNLFSQSVELNFLDANEDCKVAVTGTGETETGQPPQSTTTSAS